jgi:hypothetical protein
LQRAIVIDTLRKATAKPIEAAGRRNRNYLFVSFRFFTMKYAALLALLAGSASAFTPAQQSSRAATSLQAEKSKALPFLNRPKLVSSSFSINYVSACE